MANKVLLFGLIAIVILALIVSFKVIIIPLVLLITGVWAWNRFFTKHEEEDL